MNELCSAFRYFFYFIILFFLFFYLEWSDCGTISEQTQQREFALYLKQQSGRAVKIIYIIKIYLFCSKYSSNQLPFTDIPRITNIKIIIQFDLEYYLCTMHIS